MAPQVLNDLLKPENLNSVSGLSLITRMLVSTGMAGLHRSRRVGQGMEFSQYRAYESGDDLRLLDWKMLARSGRYYIKQADVDTHTQVKFILDASKSMEHREEGLSKLEYARILIATLAYLSHEQGDAIGLYAINENQLYQLPTSAQKEQYNRFLLQLVNIKAEGHWPGAAGAFRQIPQTGKKELIFFITDFYEDEQELTATVKQLKTARNEVVVFHLMTRQELEFDYKGLYTFEDLESGKRVKISPGETKRSYLKALEERLDYLKATFLKCNIAYELIDCTKVPGDFIKLYLKKRSQLL